MFMAKTKMALVTFETAFLVGNSTKNITETYVNN